MEAPTPSPTSSSTSLRKPRGHQVTQGGRAPPVGIEPQPRLPPAGSPAGGGRGAAVLGWSTPAGPGGLACPPGRAVEGGVLHRSGLSLLPGSQLWVLLGGGASDVPTAFLLASLCSSTIFPRPSSFWSGG